MSRLPAPLAFWVAAGLALLVSHDAIWLVQLGPGERLASVLRSAGHDYWGWVSLGILVVGVLGTTAATVRIVGLRRRAARIGAMSTPKMVGQRDRVVRTWLRLGVLVAFGFVFQENAEHFVLHAHLPGLGALAGPEYPLAIPVIATITGVAAVLLSTFTGIERALAASIAAARRVTVLRSMTRARRLVAEPSQPALSALAEPGAGRAPPPLVASTAT